jgi:hypothetical protein
VVGQGERDGRKRILLRISDGAARQKTGTRAEPGCRQARELLGWWEVATNAIALLGCCRAGRDGLDRDILNPMT